MEMKPKEQILLSTNRKHYSGMTDEQIAASVSNQAFVKYLAEQDAKNASLSFKHWSVGQEVVIAAEISFS